MKEHVEKFEDIWELNAWWIQKILRRLSWKTLIKATKSIDAKTEKNILMNLSKKGQNKYIKKSSKMKVSEKQCEKAKEKIVKMFRRIQIQENTLI